MAIKYNLNHKTVHKWENCDFVNDMPMGPEAHSTVLTRLQEAMIVSFRKHSLLGLDDCLYALKPYIANLTRSSLHRCFQRHNVSRLPSAENHGTNTPKKSFKYYPVGNIHIDITQVYTKKEKLYLLVAKDHTTKYCIAKPYKDQTRATAIEFLQKVIKDYPYKITKILTNNSLQFTHRPEVKKKHTFTSLCKAHGIAHRLTKPYHPCTNGQVERMNKTLKQTTVDKYYYKDYDSLQKHLNLFLKAYHNAKHLRSLQGNTPFELLCIFYQEHKQFYRFYLLDMSAGHYR